MTAPTPHILGIPQELRDTIYDLFFAQPPLRAAKTILVSHSHRENAAPEVISRLCRQLRADTLSLHFREANVVLDAESYDDILALEDWLKSALGGLLACADRIELRHAHCAEHNFKALGKSCRGVRTWGVLGSNDAGSSSSRDHVVTSLGCIPCRRIWVILPREMRVEVPPESDDRDLVCANNNHVTEGNCMGRIEEVLRDGGQNKGEGIRDWLESAVDSLKAIRSTPALQSEGSASESAREES